MTAPDPRDTVADVPGPVGAPPAAAAVDWDRLVSLMHVIARGLMRGRDRDHRESMDVVQSLAADLLKGGGGFVQLDAEAQRRFLRVALRNKLAAKARADHAKKRGAGGGSLPPLDEDQTAAPSGPGPATLSCRREELTAMAEALDQLDPETRAVLWLHADGVPHDQIAELFETSGQAVRQRFVRAKRDLIILARRAAGQEWDEVAGAVGLNADDVRRRHAALSALTD